MSRQMTNGARNAYSLTTFMWKADLRTLNFTQIQAKIFEIFDYTLQDGPFELQAASFGATSTWMDSISIRNVKQCI